MFCCVSLVSYPDVPLIFFKPFSAIFNPIRETDKEHEQIPSLEEK